MAAPVALEDPLDHLLAPLVLEIDVDVGRLLSLLRYEALEQHLDLIRTDRSDPEAVADERIGGRAASLTEDFRLIGEAHDRRDGQEIGRVIQLLDEPQLMVERRLHIRRDASLVALRRALAR